LVLQVFGEGRLNQTVFAVDVGVGHAPSSIGQTSSAKDKRTICPLRKPRPFKALMSDRGEAGDRFLETTRPRVFKFLLRKSAAPAALLTRMDTRSSSASSSSARLTVLAEISRRSGD
jgi:hypothetical protein